MEPEDVPQRPSGPSELHQSPVPPNNSQEHTGPAATHDAFPSPTPFSAPTASAWDEQIGNPPPPALQPEPQQPYQAGQEPWHDQSYEVPTVTSARSAAPRKRVATGALGTLAVILGTSLVAGSVGGVLGYSAAESGAEKRTSVVAIAESGDALGEATYRPASGNKEGDIAAVAAKVKPSVAYVMVSSSDGAASAGSGSGFFISSDGLFLTNNHVVTTAGENGDITIQTFDGNTYEADIVGTSPEYDLAVLQVRDVESIPLVLGDSKSVQVGEAVIAVGSPLGLQGTVTSGIVSALNRAVTAGDGTGDASYLSAIQTDAAINPGNSGGPLVDMRGEVIGINTAIATVSTLGQSGSIGLGFAVPVHIIKRISREIIETGEARTPVLGVEVDLQHSGTGARLQAITPGGSAQAADLREGDIITMVGDVLTSDASSFIVAIRSLTPGESVTLSVVRDGNTLEVPVVLGSVPSR